MLVTFSGILTVCLQHYESLIIEAKSKRESTISDAVEKAVNATVLQLQNRFEECELEKNAVADVSVLCIRIYLPKFEKGDFWNLVNFVCHQMNRTLIKEQEVLRKHFKEIEERYILYLICLYSLPVKCVVKTNTWADSLIP